MLIALAAVLSGHHAAESRAHGAGPTASAARLRAIEFCEARRGAGAGRLLLLALPVASLLHATALLAAVAAVLVQRPRRWSPSSASRGWLVLINGEVERSSLRRRVPPPTRRPQPRWPASQARSCDLLVIFVALFAMLRHFGIDPTPALAGSRRRRHRRRARGAKDARERDRRRVADLRSRRCGSATC